MHRWLVHPCWQRPGPAARTVHAARVFARLKFTVDDINPYVEPEERAQLKATLLGARNEGVFTPLSIKQNQISTPGELGGSNWGGSAADPTTGMMYVRSADQPAIHELRPPNPEGGRGNNGTPAQRGEIAVDDHE